MSLSRLETASLRFKSLQHILSVVWDVRARFYSFSCAWYENFCYTKPINYLELDSGKIHCRAYPGLAREKQVSNTSKCCVMPQGEMLIVREDKLSKIKDGLIVGE
jgi:hypothetical protein